MGTGRRESAGRTEEMSETWKIVIGIVLALILLPTILKIVSVVLGLAWTVLHLGLVALVVVFIIGLVRRLIRI